MLVEKLVNYKFLSINKFSYEDFYIQIAFQNVVKQCKIYEVFMSKESGMSLGRLLLQIAVGVMLAVAGIWALQGGGDAAVGAIKEIFSGDLSRILCIVFGVIELLAGVLLIVELFAGDKFGKFDNILMFIIMIVWIVAIVLVDFLGKGGILNGGTRNFLSWLYNFASHLIVLGAMMYLNN